MRHALVLLAVLGASSVRADFNIKKLEAPIVIDGDLSDAGWTNALRIDDFVEYAKTDNTAPPVKTTAWLAYDDRYLYIGFRNNDPNPAAIRAPFVDRDQVLADQDYVAIAIDAQNERRTAAVFRVNARGVQTDSILADANQTEDFTPDFFYEAAAKISGEGWSAEMRIPLSSLRYPDRDPQTWGVILTRNYPRDFNYMMTSTRLPKGRNCYVCYATAMAGLSGLPRGGHMTVAPYSAAARDEQWTGAQLTPQPLRSNTGADLKWSATPALTVDATLNPDFSQIESDIPQVSANSRFALSYPEKRPFFLEGVDLLATPLKLVYTRSITSPAWGVRATGQAGSTAYTLLATEDRGGGSVVLPGPEGSSFANQDFRSLAVIARARTSFGKSFAGLLFTDREVQGGGYNRVIGPDFLWKVTDADRLLGQVVVSDTQNPASIDAPSGRGHAERFVYTRDKKSYDIFTQYFAYSPKFRADDGFIASVGVHGSEFEVGGHIYPTRGFASFVRPFVGGGDDANWRGLYTGFYFEGRYGISGWWAFHPGDQDLVNHAFTRPYRYFEVHYKATPSTLLPTITLDGSIGQRVDYRNVRIGNGATFTLTTSMRPTTHLELAANISREWLDVAGSRLYDADIDRLKATYVFNARSLVRLIAQHSNTDRTVWMYKDVVSPRDGNLTLSALYGYRLNWQTTFYIGYGDFRLLDETDRLLPNHRSVFLKASYAFQR